MPAVVAVRILAGILVIALSGIPLASPEHVHELDEHGHVEFVVHRHLETHAAIDHHDGKGWDHPDEPVATLHQDYTRPSGIQLAAPPPLQSVVIPIPPRPTLVGYIEFVERLIHGPPRAPAPDRGPPSSSRLL